MPLSRTMSSIRRRTVRAFDRDLLVGAGVLPRVDQQVDERADQQRTIADDGEAALDVDRDRRRVAERRRVERRDRLVDQLADVDQLAPPRVTAGFEPRQLEHARHQQLEPLGLAAEQLEDLAAILDG